MNIKINDEAVYNKFDPYIPTEFAYIDYERSWKKCRCGRATNMRDNWCPSCGQKLGKPLWKEEN